MPSGTLQATEQSSVCIAMYKAPHTQVHTHYYYVSTSTQPVVWDATHRLAFIRRALYQIYFSVLPLLCTMGPWAEALPRNAMSAGGGDIAGICCPGSSFAT